ncbi:MAG: 4-hydroxythreonine-4-phosphate dehydrogenase PdxA [Nitrospinota bacterium]|nr:4-hydroxythreonine-4-phosphate dehydrogenase PdxA [Nitrospinota bacterium]
MKQNPFIALTMGDPAGIGAEIIVKLFADRAFPVGAGVVVIGDARHLADVADKLSVDVTIKRIDETLLSPSGKGVINVIDLDNVPRDLKIGVAGPIGGRASAEYIIKAVELASSGLVGAVTTCPINKEALNMGGYHYAGHTEMLADLTDTTDYAMLLQGGGVRVVLVTTHLAISDLPKAITKDGVLRIIRLTDRVLTGWLPARPKIAVTALNPHGGEGGLFGYEEINIIAPAIEETAEEGIDVSGPYPADSLFAEKNRKKYDVVVVMYHDQGLIPIKMAAFGKAVNVTIGLPFIRTSVDHGTAYDIAGQGVADPSSLFEAISAAAAFLNL